MLAITGTPLAVRQTVYKFYNYGIIAKIPENYDENDTSAQVLSTPEKLREGLRALAVLQASHKATRSLDRAEWIRYIDDKVSQKLAEIKDGGTYYGYGNSLRVHAASGNFRGEDVGTDNISQSLFG